MMKDELWMKISYKSQIWLDLDKKSLDVVFIILHGGCMNNMHAVCAVPKITGTAQALHFQMLFTFFFIFWSGPKDEFLQKEEEHTYAEVAAWKFYAAI